MFEVVKVKNVWWIFCTKTKNLLVWGKKRDLEKRCKELNEYESIHKPKLKQLFIDTAKNYEEADDILNELRNLNTNKELSDEDYNTILSNWDTWLIEANL